MVLLYGISATDILNKAALIPEEEA